MNDTINNLDSNFAIIEKDEEITISSWKIHELNNLNELEKLQSITRNKVIFIAPFNLANVEKWYDTNWSEKIIAMEVENELITTRQKLLSILPNNEINLWNITTDISDEDFWKLVSDVKEEIESWNINQVILSRKFTTDFKIDIETILSIYFKLLSSRWEYMTFAFNTTNEIFIWASPERHLSIENNNMIMNPIAGTIWKWKQHDLYERLVDFLCNKKETWELSMVIDEESKMSFKFTEWWNIEVPLLKEVWSVIHTEANLKWKIKNNISVLDAFKETLYAPTLVWGPIESAFKEIKKFENDSRWYYWWAFWVLWEDFLDTAIVIRTAFIDKLNWILTVRAWAWIVKGSIPEKEAEETILKSNGFFWALKWTNDNNSTSLLSWMTEEQIKNIEYLLEKRKSQLSSFFINLHLHNCLEVEEIKWKKFILINNWDDFIYISWFMIKKMWWVVEIVDNSDFDVSNIDDFDVILLWPWYWDINDKSNNTMLNLLNITEKLIKHKKKILWICLWHQAICKTKWYEIKKQEKITQWEQLEVEIRWKKEMLWFYNSFSPVIKWNEDNIETFSNDRVLKYSDENISSIQPHPESIMSINWFEVLKSMILDLIKK